MTPIFRDILRAVGLLWLTHFAIMAFILFLRYDGQWAESNEYEDCVARLPPSGNPWRCPHAHDLIILRQEMVFVLVKTLWPWLLALTGLSAIFYGFTELVAVLGLFAVSFAPLAVWKPERLVKGITDLVESAGDFAAEHLIYAMLAISLIAAVIYVIRQTHVASIRNERTLEKLESLLANIATKDDMKHGNDVTSRHVAKISEQVCGKLEKLTIDLNNLLHEMIGLKDKVSILQTETSKRINATTSQASQIDLTTLKSAISSTFNGMVTSAELEIKLDAMFKRTSELIAKSLPTTAIAATKESISFDQVNAMHSKQINDLQQKLKKAENDRASLQAKFKATTTELEPMKKASDRVAQLQKDVGALEYSKADLQVKLNAAQMEATNLRAQLQAANSTNSTSNAHTQSLRNEKTKLEAELKSAKAQIKDLTVAHDQAIQQAQTATAVNTDLMGKKDALERELTASYQLRDLMVSEGIKLETKASGLESQVAELQRHIEQLQQHQSPLSQPNAELANQNANLSSQISDLAKRYATEQSARAAAEAQVANQHQQLQQQQLHLQQLQQQQQQLQQQLEQERQRQVQQQQTLAPAPAEEQTPLIRAFELALDLTNLLVQLFGVPKRKVFGTPDDFVLAGRLATTVRTMMLVVYPMKNQTRLHKNEAWKFIEKTTVRWRGDQSPGAALHEDYKKWDFTGGKVKEDAKIVHTIASGLVLLDLMVDEGGEFWEHSHEEQMDKNLALLKTVERVVVRRQREVEATQMVL